MFQLKKRPPDYQGRKGRKMDDKGLRGKDGLLPPEKLPYLVELSPGRATRHRSAVASPVLCCSGTFWSAGGGGAVNSIFLLFSDGYITSYVEVFFFNIEAFSVKIHIRTHCGDAA